ncbi:MAG: NAD(P)/FAD-dependent oxidoreductase [Sandaracinaceae bacterium]|nr:NAD(P)/FAD-dependent oxidoreductase [Sandaracinaceae bacterium]
MGSVADTASGAAGLLGLLGKGESLLEHVDVLIIGAGISGIGAACHLRMKNPGTTFTILEGREAIGGTWDLFRYPGIRSDSDMYTFGYSFKPWVEDQDIATGDAILRYLNETVDEHGLRKHIRFGHRVQKVAWSSADKRWVATVQRVEDGSTFELASDFLLTCTGYYDYERGHQPDFEGLGDYRGSVVHPQHWPQDLDYAGKKVLVVGSGATAVTLVPSMAKTAGHVTMLQRSPTYIFSRPAVDPIAKGLRAVLPSKAAYGLTRIKNIGLQRFAYALARRAPQKVRANLREMAVQSLGPDFDVDLHFNPTYDPWDQRVCLIPDDDLYASLREGTASVVTDTIERFTETGVRLASGETIEADVVVLATGLELQFLGGMQMVVDGQPIESGELVSYRGLMFGDVPNWVAVLGYTSASWTLKADLASEFVCRLLGYMKEHGYDTVVPRLGDEPMAKTPIMGKLTSGYVKRAADKMPKQGAKAPWLNHDNYLRDVVSIKLGGIDDGVLEFGKSAAAKRGKRFSYRGKTAVVTGAASGIGAALAKDLAGRGTHLILIDVDATNLAVVADAARARGVDVSEHVVDMGDMDAIGRFGDALAASGRTIDLLINNAGVALGGTFEEVSRDDFDWLMNINFRGVVEMTRSLLPLLHESPDAHIANVSSVFGLIAPPSQAAYCSSKFAVRGFSEALRHELRSSTVGVSVIHPGGIKTNIARNARVGVVAADEEVEERLKDIEKSFITTPEKAASIILKGIERRKARILVGPDAHLVETLERLFPTTNLEVLAKLLGWKEPPARRPAKPSREAVIAHPVNGRAPTIQA